MTDNYPSMKALTDQALNIFDDILQSKSSITGLPTGLISLDEVTSGLQAGDLIIIGGQSSMGKTSLAMSIVENAVNKSDTSIGLFTMETTAIKLTIRLLNSMARFDNTKVATTDFEQEDFKKLNHASAILSSADIYIEDTNHLTLDDICQRVKMMDQQVREKQNTNAVDQGRPNPKISGLRLVVIDYLQLINLKKSVSPYENELEEIGRRLKNLAKELGASVILLSQFDYKMKKINNQIPKLKDFGKYGTVIGYADLVLTIHRDEVYHPDSHEKGTALVSILKHRNGPLCSMKLRFDGEFGRVDNYKTNQAK